MDTQRLNLARKWRSKQFDHIVGQELSVRMLKNSLYLNQFFPVYLFSGQRGCGKTTTARVFAAALNCSQLPEFQKNPKTVVIPCLECDSCTAMGAGNHPDFIEIDAASHTGVDNVRTIIEAAALLPVMGNKKLYLIDEAHMLSKAAFNAFLKILEEPPESVIFMLATTDPQKIIDTVRSRCFQLFFGAIKSDALVDHLKHVCQKEEIKADQQALAIIVKETEGSARDALNLLEQVRFSSGVVTVEAVLRSLGHLSETEMFGIFEKIVTGNPAELINYLQEIKFESYNAMSVWEKLVELVRTMLFVRYGAIKADDQHDAQRFESLVRKTSAVQLASFLELLYQQELLLGKTTVQHGLLEMTLLHMCGQLHQETETPAAPRQAPTPQRQDQSVSVQKKTTFPVVSATNEMLSGEVDQRWKGFLEKITGLSDPLLSSIFKQARFLSFDQEHSQLLIGFTQEVSFFEEWLRETETVWMQVLKEFFGPSVQYSARFEKTAAETTPVKMDLPRAPEQRGTPNKIISSATRQRAAVVDISDKEKWKRANQLQEAFGGTIVEVQADEKAE